MPVKCVKYGDDWVVYINGLRMRFSKTLAGISSLAYLKSGVWHEAVNHDSYGSLFLPRLLRQGLPDGYIYPFHSGTLTPEFIGKGFAKFKVTAYLSNPTQGGSFISFPYEAHYSVREDGDLNIKTIIGQGIVGTGTITEEYILDPKDDADIALGRDSAPNLWFAGFYSDNTGDASSDLSHDAVLTQYGFDFDNYITHTSDGHNCVGLGKHPATWMDQDTAVRRFRLHLSADGTSDDVTDAASFQSVGDSKGIDFRLPDPLNGSINSGDILIGSLVGDGFDESEGDYTIAAA